MKICGIYKIENNINHKVYIGQSRNIQKRWAQHKWKPFSENPAISESCPQLYQAIRKYGVNNFTFTILEELLPEELDAREIYWISFYDSFNAGYNMTLGGAGSTAEAREKAVATCLQRYGCKSFLQDPEIRERIKQTNIERYGVSNPMKNPEISEKNANARFKNGSTIPVVNVETGKIYRSINQAAKDCGISKPSNIGEVLKGKRHSAGGYHWRSATKEEIKI